MMKEENGAWCKVGPGLVWQGGLTKFGSIWESCRTGYMWEIVNFVVVVVAAACSSGRLS